MSNVIKLQFIRKEAGGVAYRIVLNEMPLDIIEAVFYAAIDVAWQYGDGGQVNAASMDALLRAVEKTTQYTIPVDRQTGEPIGAA